MKRALSIILPILLFSCSESEENRKASVQETQIHSKVENLKRRGLERKGDKSERNVIQQVGLKSLKGKVFLLGQNIDLKSCEISQACDCCNADLLFISEELFIYDDLCEGHYVSKGKYKLVGNQLTLEFEPTLVSYYHNEENEINSKAPETILKLESTSRPKQSFTVSNCGDLTIITNNNKSEDLDLLDGIMNQKATLTDKVNLLKQIGVWKPLSM